MKMWIACLAAYNSGRLYGEWADVSTDADENAAQIARVLKGSPVRDAEEWALMDYEAPRALINILGENPDYDVLANAATIEANVAERWTDFDDKSAVLDVMLDGARASDLAEFTDVDEWTSERFAGGGETLIGWCADFLDETGFFGELSGASKEVCERYFDFESYARDMELGGDISTARVNGRVLVFWNR